MLLTAYVDESYDLSLGVYILTASLVDLTVGETSRADLRDLRTGPHKVHWYKSSELRRLELARMAAKVSYFHLPVIGQGAGFSPERARRKCLEALLFEMDSMKIDTLVLESRQRHNDLHDRQIVAACRKKKLLSGRCHVSFAPGASEPLLWIPDIVCGAVLSMQRGDPVYLNELQDSVQIIRIDVH